MKKIQIVMNPAEYRRMEIHKISFWEAIKIWLCGLVIEVQIQRHINCRCVIKPYFGKEGADNE